jgi:hypothetical protein
LRKIFSYTDFNCWRILLWSIHPPPFSCRSRGVQGAWSGEENTQLCCALLRLPDRPSTIPKTTNAAFYEHVEIPGRGAESVRRQLYTLFTQGLSVRAIRQEMGVQLEAWCLEADSADAMVVVEQPVAAPVESGAKGASQGRSGTGRFARKRSAQDVAGSAGQLDDPASKVAMGA